MYFLVSLILHVVVVVLFGLSGLSFRAPAPARPGEGEYDRHVFHVIEVPADIPEQKPTRQTDIVSDRVAAASDMNPRVGDDLGDPYSEGLTEIPEFEMPGADIAQARRDYEIERPGPQHAMPEAEAGDLAGDVPTEGIGEYVVDEEDGNQSTSAGRSSSFRNLLSDAGRKGALSFNTYDWDFAPYMLAMKRAIESHLFPPYAFTHLGLVSGNNVVRFTVMPDGRIRGLEILGSDTHFSLDRTSVRAIESSVPFLPLPKDFPEEYLEVTAHFSYVVRGKD
jgi:TonB family protein